MNLTFKVILMILGLIIIGNHFMNFKLLVVSVLILTAFINLSLALYSARKLRFRASLPYMLLMFSVTLYSFGYAVRLWGTGFDDIYTGIRIVYAGAAFLGTFWLILALSYSGYDRLLNRFALVILFVIPVITLVMVNTNEYHHLYYTRIDIRTEGPFHLATATRGVWYYVHFLYNNLTSVIGIALFFIMAFRTSGLYRKQAVTMFIASAIPWTGYILYLLHKSYYRIDYAPFFFLISGPLLGIALFRFRLLDLIPIARTLVFETMKNPVIVLDASNRIVDYNSEAKNIFNFLMKEKGQGIPAEKIFADYDEIMTQLTDDSGSKVEILVPLAEGGRYFNSQLMPIFSKSGRKIGKVLNFQDVTSEKELIKRLRIMATTDTLTGIFNRRRFLQICDQEMKRVQRNRQPLSMLLIDLDHFKKINDAYGHQAGDFVLKEAARCFQDTLRSSDVLARYGGEEFVILLPETDREGALTIAERHNRNIASLVIPFNDLQLSVTASIGVSTLLDPENDSIEKILSRADKAMYAAKERGRNCVVVYDPVLQS